VLLCSELSRDGPSALAHGGVNNKLSIRTTGLPYELGQLLVRSNFRMPHAHHRALALSLSLVLVDLKRQPASAAAAAETSRSTIATGR